MVLRKKLFTTALVVFLAAGLFLFVPAKSFASTDFLLFGNYDFLTPNGGNVSSQNQNPSWSGLFHNGYGGGLGLAYWFGGQLGVRFEAQGNFFGMNQPGMSLESAPITGGVLYKLSSGLDSYPYFLVDGGAGYELGLPNTTAPALTAKGSSSAWSSYFDIGLGYAFSFLFVEAKYAYLTDPIPNYPGQHAMWYIPITVGLKF